MSLHTIEDLTSCILDFQANIVRVTNRKKTTLVDPDIEAAHAMALTTIWACSKLEEEIDADGHPLKWRKLGFDTEDIVQEFSEVGVLGLECLVSISQMTAEILIILLPCFRKDLWRMIQTFPKLVLVLLFQVIGLNQIEQVILEQLSRGEERRCPIAKASNEVVELLSEHWAIFAPGCMLSCDVCP